MLSVELVSSPCPLGVPPSLVDTYEVADKEHAG